MQRQSQRIDLTDDPLSLKPPCCHLADSNNIVDSTTLYQTLTATEAETEAGQGQQAPPVRSLATTLSTSKAIIIFSPLSLTRSLSTTRAMFFFIAIIDKKSEFYQTFSSLTKNPKHYLAKAIIIFSPATKGIYIWHISV